jgi:glycosyltransferase involved in cell wall biosynthesis
MKISVIIPVKNRASLIGFTLKSILHQSHKPYEVIVVDDSSTDNIDEVITAFKNQIIFIKSKGKGPGAARNTGLQIATGDAIQFFDSDDLMTVNKLEVQSKLLEKSSTDFVYGPYVKACEVDGIWQRNDAIMQYHPVPGKKLVNLVLEGWCLLSQSVLFRKEILKEAGKWREDLMTHEDREYWFRIASIAKSYIHENESCVIYRQHGNQITNNALVDRERWLNGIKAELIIRENMKGTYDFHSRLMFLGHSGYIKLNYNRNFKQESHIPIRFSESVTYYYYVLISKLIVKSAGTGWKPMLGAIHSDKIFENYLQQLK